MASIQQINSLLAMVAREQDCDAALKALTQQIQELTRCRNAMIAVMNEEQGCLELKHGAGLDWGGGPEVSGLRSDERQTDGIIAEVARSGTAYRTGNVQNEPKYRILFESTVSEIAVPIRNPEGRVKGVLNLESDQTNAFTKDDQDICETFALLAAIVIDRNEVLAREQALIEIGSALDTAMTEDELIERVIDVAGNLLRFQAFSAFLYDSRKSAFVLTGSVGELRHKVGEISYQMGEGLTGWVCESRQPILLANPHSDPRWRGRHLEFPSDQIASFLAVPVVSRGKTIGVLRALRRTTDNPLLDNTFTETDLRVLQAIAEQVATGLENIRNLETLIRSERMVAWGELSAKSSHMIGNRVFALKGDVNELRHLICDDPLSKDALTEIQVSLSANVLRIEEILQDFRDFVTATQLNLAPGDVNQVILETIHEVLPKGSANIDLQLGQALPHALIDDKKLRRAISELLENALGYTTEGSLRIETSVETNEKGSRRHKPMVRIVVQDTGPGVPPDKKTQIFQPFYSSRVKGMGLGLSIVKGIVDSHGGTVFEEGKQGKGARFVILLPVPNRPRKEK